MVPTSLTIPVNIAPSALLQASVVARAGRRGKMPGRGASATASRRRKLSRWPSAGKIAKLRGKSRRARANEAIDAGSADRHGELRARASPGGGARRLRAAALRPYRRRDQAGRKRPGPRHARRRGHPPDRRRLALRRDARLRRGLRERRRPLAGHDPARRHDLGGGLGERRRRAPGGRRPEGDHARGDPGRPVRRHLRAVRRPAAGRGADPRRAPPARSPRASPDQTPDPQVEVRRVAGDGATVSVMGGVRSPGVYPIEAPTLRLSAMLAGGRRRGAGARRGADQGRARRPDRADLAAGPLRQPALRHRAARRRPDHRRGGPPLLHRARRHHRPVAGPVQQARPVGDRGDRHGRRPRRPHRQSERRLRLPRRARGGRQPGARRAATWSARSGWPTS